MKRHCAQCRNATICVCNAVFFGCSRHGTKVTLVGKRGSMSFEAGDWVPDEKKASGSSPRDPNILWSLTWSCYGSQKAELALLSLALMHSHSNADIIQGVGGQTLG